MPINYSIREVGDLFDLHLLRENILRYHLGYPNYEDWTDRTMVQVELGFKKAILAFDNGSWAGNIIYQPHKEIPRIREIKNLRINPRVRGRGLASFLVKLVETDEPQSIDALIVDARDDAKNMDVFLRYSGFLPLMSASLYEKDVEETIYVKPLREPISDSNLDSHIISHFPAGKILLYNGSSTL